MTYPRIIGLSGVARAGKDTVGEILRDLYGYQVLSFSHILNEALIALNPVVPVIEQFGQNFTNMRYAELVEQLGYERAKEIPEVRRLLQAMGTEVGRDLLGENIWVDALFDGINIQGDPVVITNVRFPNEYMAVRNHKGTLWRVDRPGYEPSNDHISDRALDQFAFDAYIYNEGSIRELSEKVLRLMEKNWRGDGLQAAHNNGSRAGA